MKKRVYSMLLVLCMLFSLLTITAAAEQSASFSVNTAANATVGDTITVSVSLSTIEKGRNFQCRLNYDASLLEYVSHSSSGATSQTSGTVSVAAFTMGPETLGGTILTVQFKAIAAGTATFSLSDCKAGAGEVSADIAVTASNASTVIEMPHVCDPVDVEGYEATCSEPGLKAHQKCACGKLYLNGVEVQEKDLVIPATGDHNYEDGVCTECGKNEPTTPPAPVPPTPAPVKPVNPFNDVAESDYYYDAVLWAVEKGITNGISATQFGSNQACTRAQMVTFLWRSQGSPKATATEMPFTDVAAGSYYYDAVLWAVEKGITNGTSATTFSPDATVTRAQVVTFLWRLAEKPESDVANPFTDVAADAYYYDAVLWAVEEGITNGISATKFGSNDNCLRCQIVTFLYRFLA